MKIAFMTSGTINSSLSYRPIAFAKELVKKGHEVYIFAPRFDKYSHFKDEHIKNIDGLKIVRPWQPKIANFELSLIPYIFSSIVLLFNIKPKIVHIFKPNPLTISSLFLKFVSKTSVILDVDDLDVEVMEIENNPLLKIKLVELSEKIASKYANGITVASKLLYKKYYNQYSGKPIQYLSNGAEFDKLDQLSINNSSKRKIVFIGNMNRTNILEPLIIACKTLKEKKLLPKVIIIGDGIYLDYFKQLTKKLSLEKEINFLGHIKRDNLGRYVKAGDIGYCYMPNELTIKACSSMKVFQYMQFGAVPLVSNVGDLPLYTFNGKAGFIAKHSNQNSLVNTLIEAIDNKREQIKKINYVQKFATKQFSWEALAFKTEKAYINMLKNN